jgi:hypothetical protein
VTGLGSPARANALTVLVWPGATPSAFSLIDDDEAPTEITATTGALHLSRALATTYFRIRRDAIPAAVAIHGTALGAQAASDQALEAAAAGWRYDATHHWLWVKVAAGGATDVTITP